MIKSNELRIDNYVLVGLEIQKVDRIVKGDIGYYDPIPLTEEWLVKFGFEKDSFYQTFKMGDYCISVKNKEFHFMNDPCSNAGCHYLTTVKYVHSLQNLYFALTDQELEMK